MVASVIPAAGVASKPTDYWLADLPKTIRLAELIQLTQAPAPYALLTSTAIPGSWPSEARYVKQS